MSHPKESPVARVLVQNMQSGSPENWSGKKPFVKIVPKTLIAISEKGASKDMKHPKKPTVRQSVFIEENGFDFREWMVVKDTSSEMWIVKKDDPKFVLALKK